MKTTRTAALEEIVGAIKKVAANFDSYGEPEYLAANADAMLKLAIAYSVVKHGVILPDWTKEGEHDQQGSGAQKL